MDRCEGEEGLVCDYSSFRTARTGKITWNFCGILFAVVNNGHKLKMSRHASDAQGRLFSCQSQQKQKPKRTGY